MARFRLRTQLDRALALTSPNLNCGLEDDGVLPEMKMVGLLACRVRDFLYWAVIGSKVLVNVEVSSERERFSAKRGG
jgi:hypothetical protein